jgi:hypothetical protein
MVPVLVDFDRMQSNQPRVRYYQSPTPGSSKRITIHRFDRRAIHRVDQDISDIRAGHLSAANNPLPPPGKTLGRLGCYQTIPTRSPINPKRVETADTANSTAIAIQWVAAFKQFWGGGSIMTLRLGTQWQRAIATGSLGMLNCTSPQEQVEA